MIRCLTIIICLCVLANCSSSPEPQYYTLSAIAGVQTSCAAKIKLRRPVIPQTLDRPEIVMQDGEFQVVKNDYNLWSEPLDKMIERVLAEDLRLRLPQGTVVTESSGANVKAQFTVNSDLQQFGTDADSKAVLQAENIIYNGDKAGKSLPVILHGDVVTSSEVMAKNLSVLVGNFADNIVADTCK